MVAHDEEHDGLLDEFELQDENQKARPNSSRRTARRCARLVRRRVWCLIAGVVTLALLCIIGAVFSSIGTLKAPKGPAKGGHLGIRLHPEEHASRPPTTLTFNWTITAGLRSPDGVEKRVYLANGTIPCCCHILYLTQRCRSISGANHRGKVWRPTCSTHSQ